MDPFDQTDRIAAATLVGSLITSKHPSVTSVIDLTSLARVYWDCAFALSNERQNRQLQAGSR